MFEAMRRYADRTSGGGINPKAPSAPKPRPLRHSRVGIAGWTARHVLITLAVWFAVLAGAFVLAGSLNVSSEGGLNSTSQITPVNAIAKRRTARNCGTLRLVIAAFDRGWDRMRRIIAEGKPQYSTFQHWDGFHHQGIFPFDLPANASVSFWVLGGENLNKIENQANAYPVDKLEKSMDQARH